MNQNDLHVRQVIFHDTSTVTLWIETFRCISKQFAMLKRAKWLQWVGGGAGQTGPQGSPGDAASLHISAPDYI